jgi:flagellar hook-associated protein 2
MEIGGIDADTIVTQLMAIEERPLTALQARKSAAQTASSEIARVRSNVDAFRLAAERIWTSAKFNRFAATTSDSSIVAASVGANANTGSLTFTVDQLARAHGLRSIGSVASDSITVTSDPFLAVAAGTSKIGVATVRSGAGLGAGAFTLEVTQSSAGATAEGSAALAPSTIITGSNNTVDVTINGTARTLTIAAGTYDANGLSAAVQNAIDATGGGATASLTTDGSLQITTAREGSTASIQITGGNALGDLGLNIDASAHVGTDGVFEVGGTSTTVTSIEPGNSIAVDTGSGTLDVALSGGLRIGSSRVSVVSTGNGSLASVAAAINNANNGVSAAAVRVTTGEWRLQLGATATGEDGRIAIDDAALSGLGGMIETSAARNAQITIGTGPGAYSIEASGNTFTDVMGGVTLTAVAASTTPVTVSVTRDDASLASDVANLVSRANDLLANIKVQTRTDPTAGTKGPLAGDATIRQLADQIRNSLTGQVSGLGTSLPSSVGIERTRDGSLTFDQAKFLAALRDGPDSIARLFSQGGTGNANVSFDGAKAGTISGTYDIQVTTAATRATTGLIFDGGALAGTRVGVRVGTTTATFDVTAGDTPAEIVSGLNASFARAGLDVVATLDATGLRVTSERWGSAGDFEFNADLLGAGTWDAEVGTDVVGTIDGEVATGIGRTLSLSQFADSKAAGLSVTVAEGATGSLGTIEYLPGIAARVVELATALTDDKTGSLTTAKEAADRRVTSFNDQITRLEDRLSIRETNMRRQWASFQSLLSSLQTQGNWISSQLSSLGNNWGQ